MKEHMYVYLCEEERLIIWGAVAITWEVTRSKAQKEVFELETQSNIDTKEKMIIKGEMVVKMTIKEG